MNRIPLFCRLPLTLAGLTRDTQGVRQPIASNSPSAPSLAEGHFAPHGSAAVTIRSQAGGANPAAARDKHDSPPGALTAPADELQSSQSAPSLNLNPNLNLSGTPDHNHRNGAPYGLAGRSQVEPATSAELPNRLDTFDGAAGAPQSDQPAPISSSVALSARQRRVAGERRILLISALPLLQSGLSINEASRTLGLRGPALWRLLKLAGNDSLLYRQAAVACAQLIDGPLEALAPDEARGRESDFEALARLDAVRQQLHFLYCATLGASSAEAAAHRKTGSMAMALARLGDSPLIPEHLAQKLRSGSQPAPLLRLLRSITAEVEQKVRGDKHYQLASFKGRRGNQIELEDGTTITAQAGKLWVFDDMSVNLPFWFELPEAALASTELKALAEKHGCSLGRQGLFGATWTPNGLCWLGCELLGRNRDAYTSDIILRFLRRLMQNYGKPDIIIFEQGIWKSRNISGFNLNLNLNPNLTLNHERPEMPEDQRANITGGLRALGIRIVYVYSPRGPLKTELEGRFNELQKVVPTFCTPGEGQNIGRYGGEFEHAATQLRRANDGVHHPRDLGFLHIDRCADLHWQAMQWLDQDAHTTGGTVATPAAALAGSTPRAALTVDDLAVFLPEFRELQIDGLHVWPQVNGIRHSYINPELFAALGNGTRVGVRFDPAEPTLGAAIYSLSQVSGLRSPVSGLESQVSPGSFLAWADYHADAPLLSFRDRGDAEGLQPLKRVRLAHRTAFRALDLPSKRTVQISEIRDGRGNVATRSNGPDRGRSPSAAAPENPAPSVPARTHRSILTPPTKDEFARKRSRFLESAAAARELEHTET